MIQTLRIAAISVIARRSVQALFIGLFTAVALAHAASAFEPFSAERLSALQQAGKPVLVEVYAEWCGTCKRQGPILDSLLSDPEFAPFAALRIDWDKDRAVARELGAPRQSTLFVYRGGKQVAMSVAETNEKRLREFMRKGLQ
jgi:thioredoxin 1